LTLSLAERSRLLELEEIVEHGIASFVAVGNALMAIRDERLYIETRATFEVYLGERWQISRQHGYRMIDSARVVAALSPGGDAPTSERHARELVSLVREDEAQAVDLWRELRAEHGDAVTADVIRDAVSERRRFERHAQTTRNINSSESFEWYTPGEYVDAARAVLGGIDLDPASCEQANEVVRAAEFFTEQDDGLSREWCGRVWLNPPYGRLCPQFVAKLTGEYEAGRVSEAILLVSAYATETAWFQPLLDERPICFTSRRIAFFSPSGRGSSSTHGSALVYFGCDAERFADVFCAYGAIVEKFSRRDALGERREAA